MNTETNKDTECGNNVFEIKLAQEKFGARSPKDTSVSAINSVKQPVAKKSESLETKTRSVTQHKKINPYRCRPLDYKLRIVALLALLLPLYSLISTHT
ncbi:MAG: hypothetical protein ACOYXT_24345 [Bacteroidota bacterium]